MSAPDVLLAGRYRLVKPLASGGMGSVWEARDEVLQRPVAVKRLLNQPGLSPRDAEDAVNRAMREARITARLHHPNAVPVYDVVEQDGRPCLIMQYVPSQSLQHLLTEHEVLPAATVAGIGADIAAALAAAHLAGIVHRDVKPSNVLITEDGTAKLTDFGVSHAVGDVSLTSTGMVTGTPAFLSPEVARGASSNAASDVFSLGATLYAALEGQPPFGSGDNAMATLHRVASGKILLPRRSGPMTPLLSRMLATDPAERPSIVDVRNTLSALRDDLGSLGAMTQRMASSPAIATATLPVASALAGPRTERAPVAAAPLELDQTALDQMRGAGAQRNRPVPSGEPSENNPRRRRTPALIAVAAIALAVLVGLVLLNAGNGSSKASSTHTPATKAATPLATHSSTATHITTHAAAPPTVTTRATTPTPSATPTPQTGTPTAAQLAGAITSYYALLPGNTDAGWNRLTPNYQQTTSINRQSYDSWWGSIQQVQVSNASGTSPDRAVATITYTFKDGRVVVEQTAYRLVPQGGILKIDQSNVLSSQTQ